MTEQYLPPSSSGKMPNWSGVVGYNPPPVQIPSNAANSEWTSPNDTAMRNNISAKSNTNANRTNVNQPTQAQSQPGDEFDAKLSRLATMQLANANDAMYPCGLSNPENKCFMNVVLQCLLASSAFLRVLLSFQADAQIPANRCPYTTRFEYQKNSGIRETKSQTTYISNQQPQLVSPSQSAKPSYQATESKSSTQSTTTQSNQAPTSKKPSYSSTQQQQPPKQSPQPTQPQKYQPPPQVKKQNAQQKTQSQQKESQTSSSSKPSNNTGNNNSNNGSHISNNNSNNTNSTSPTSKASHPTPESPSALPKILSFSSFTATAFISCLREFYTSGVDLQEDAQEYLNFLLSKFEVELKSSVTAQKTPTQPNGEGDQWITKGKKKDTVNLTETFINSTSTDSSVVTKIFGGQLQSVVAKKGGLNSSSSEPYYCIHLDVMHESIASLESALSFYSEKENVEYYNEQHRKVMATKQTKIEKLSDVLIFHFKRFTGVDDKINKSITFPEILSLHPNWCSSAEMTSANRSQFELYAVILHHGKETRGGHYTCFTYNATYQSWFHFDDRSVTKSDLKKVLASKDAYLLFYRRRMQ